MSTPASSSLAHTWRDAIDSQLLHWLLQRAIQPGLFNPQLAETVLARFRHVNRFAALLEELLQRYGSEEFARGEQTPIVYVHLQQDRAASSTVGSTTSVISHVVRTTAPVERPVVQGTAVSLTPQQQSQEEGRNQFPTTAARAPLQPPPIAASHHRQDNSNEAGKTLIPVVRPTTSIREGMPPSAVALQRTPTVIQSLQQMHTNSTTPPIRPEPRLRGGGESPQLTIQTTGLPSLTLPRASSDTSALAPQQRPEQKEVLPVVRQDVAQSAVVHAANRTPVVSALPVVQRQGVAETRQPLTSAPPTLTLARPTPPSPTNDRATRTPGQLEPGVRSEDNGLRGRVRSLLDERGATSHKTAAATSAPTVKESSAREHAGATPARELRELATQVQQKLDIEALAEKVQRQIRRRLLVDHERRGRTRWT